MPISPTAGDALTPADRVAAAGIGVLTLACYWYCAARTVVLEDDGYFLQAAWFAAPAHPPGYPLYVALAHVALGVPLGEPALRVHLLTGLFAALACALLFLLARRLALPRVGAAAAALALGFSGTWWSQAVIAEVYSLNVLLFLACALLALEAGRRPARVSGPVLAGAGLLYGLALSNHWPLLVLSTPALLALAWPARREVLAGAPMIAAGVILGLSPYAWMIWRTHVVPEYSFAGPITSWREFQSYVSRAAYAGMDHSSSADWGDRLQYLGLVLRELPAQFGWPGAVFGVIGFARQWRLWPARVIAFALAGFLGSTLVLVCLLGFDYDELHRTLFRVYPLIAHALFALWIGLGITVVGAWCATGARGVSSRLLAASALLMVAGVPWIMHLPENARGDDRWAEAYGRALLESLPTGARLYGNADTVDGPVGYLHRVLGVRPDVTLVNGMALTVEGALYRPWALPRDELEELIVRFVESDARPVFYTGGFPNPFAQRDHGLYFAVDPASAPGTYTVDAAPRVAAYFAALDRIPVPADPWASMHYRRLRQDQCRWMVAQSGGALPVDIGTLPPACRGLHGRLWLADLVRPAGAAGADLVLGWLPDDPVLRAEAITRADADRFLALRTWALAVRDRGTGVPGRAVE